MKKTLCSILLLASATLYAQKSDRDNLPPTTNAAASGAVQMENDGLRKYGSGSFKLYVPSSLTYGKMNISDNGIINFSSPNELEYYGFGVNPSGQMEFMANGALDFGSSLTKMVLDDNTGNVGIGNLSPEVKLHVTGLENDGTVGTLKITSGSQNMLIDGNEIDVSSTGLYLNNNTNLNVILAAGGGKVGIGATAPVGRFQVDHGGNDSDPHINIRATGSQSRINWTTDDNAKKWIAQSYLNSATDALNYLRFEYSDGTLTDSDVFVMTGNGNVGIGTTSPDNKLDVKGVIRSDEVIVETGWADYVFADSYQLTELEKVEAFIKENKHLPNMPSASEIQKKGAHVAELMTKMMEKIEELTLYTIRQQKEIDAMKIQLQNK